MLLCLALTVQMPADARRRARTRRRTDQGRGRGTRQRAHIQSDKHACSPSNQTNKFVEGLSHSLSLSFPALSAEILSQPRSLSPSFPPSLPPSLPPSTPAVGTWQELACPATMTCGRKGGAIHGRLSVCPRPLSFRPSVIQGRGLNFRVLGLGFWALDLGIGGFGKSFLGGSRALGAW